MRDSSDASLRHSCGPSDAPRLALLLAVMTVLRVVFAVSTPLLAGEAYYWLWGQYPDAGYYDHPPMVGWMCALFFGWIDRSPLAARSSAILLAIPTTLVLYAFARDLYGDRRIAWHVALLYNLIPLFDMGGVIIEPDNALVLFCALAWLAFWRAAERGDWIWWIGAGAAAGLALLSKFHAWVLLPPLYLFLVLSAKHRRWLATPRPWAALAVALTVLSPNLAWNARREWLNYAYQWRRSDIPEAEFQLDYFLQYLAMPALSLSPLVYAAVLWACWRAARGLARAAEPRALYLLCAGLPLPLFLGALSFGVKISPHWPGVGYVPLVILAAAMVLRGEIFDTRYFRAMLVSSAALTALAHIAPYVIWALPGGVAYPLNPELANTDRVKESFVGWPELGARVRRLRDEMNAEAPTIIMAKNWHLTSMLAFYSGRTREAFVYTKADAHNYKLWMDARGGLKGANAVVVVKKDDPNKFHRRLEKKYDKYHRVLDPLFERVVEIPSFVVWSDGEMGEYMGVEIERPKIKEYLIFRCYGFKGELTDRTD